TSLRGLHIRTLTPHLVTVVYVIIITSGAIELTGKIASQIFYYMHSAHCVGIKSVIAGEFRENNPMRLLYTIIIGMLPKIPLVRKQGKKLFVYGGAEHPHEAQQPENYELRG